MDEIQDEFEKNSWLGILFDEIENKGFEEASKFLLGIKSDRGKVVVPGVRSISARGKKGSTYKYFPDAAAEPKAKGPKKAKTASAPKEKPEKRYEDPEYSDLKTWYVMNKVIQMPTGKFNNLYDSVMLYLDPGFTTEKAIDYIEGRFDPAATATKKYFTEELIQRVLDRFIIT